MPLNLTGPVHFDWVHSADESNCYVEDTLVGHIEVGEIKREEGKHEKYYVTSLEGCKSETGKARCRSSTPSCASP